MSNMTQLKIKTDRFTVDVEPGFLYNLIERAIEKFGNTGELADFIIKKYKMNKHNRRNLSDNMRKWQRKKRNIPLNYYLTIGKYLGIKNEDLCQKIDGIRLYLCREILNIKYPLELNRFWGFVSECIRVEGTATRKRIMLENTNTEITSKFKQYIGKLGVSGKSIKEHLNVRIHVPENTSRDDIKIVNLKTNKEIRNFHIRTLKLKRGCKKEAIFYCKTFTYETPLIYKIYCPDNHFCVEIIVPRNGKIICKSSLKDERYQKACVSLCLQVHNRTFVWMLKNIFEIPIGNKSGIIRIPNIIKSAENEILAEVISAVLASESTIAPRYKFVAVASRSTKYLKDFQEILRKFNITSSVSKDYVKICGIRNFKKLNRFDFIIKEKINAFKRLLISKIEQSPKGQSKTLYLKSINELGIVTWQEIMAKSNRMGNSSRIYLKELIDRKYIRMVRNSRPRKYKITASGIKYLERNKMYWV